MIHILEDDPGVSHALRLLLEQLGHEVSCHPDAESFFELAPPHHEDLVIVDLALPGISGVQVVRWINELADPPRVVIMSGLPQTAIDREISGSVKRPPVVVRKPLTEASIAALL